MKHTLKVDIPIFQRIKDGSKTFVIADPEHHFQLGDDLELNEWDPKRISPTDPAPKGLTESDPLEFKAGFIQIVSLGTIVSLIPKPKEVSKPKSGIRNKSK